MMVRMVVEKIAAPSVEPAGLSASCCEEEETLSVREPLVSERAGVGGEWLTWRPRLALLPLLVGC